jgi:Zn-finger nucleic acid-binding protein
MAGHEFAHLARVGRMWKCIDCRGMWLDQTACELLVNEEMPDEPRGFIRVDGPSTKTAPVTMGYRTAARQSGDSSMLCPQCSGSLLSYATSEGRHGVTVKLDVCAGHGTWFDRGEARTLLSAVEMKRLDVQFERERHARNMVNERTAWPHAGPEPVAPLPASPPAARRAPSNTASNPARNVPRQGSPRDPKADPDTAWSVLLDDLYKQTRGRS